MKSRKVILILSAIIILILSGVIFMHFKEKPNKLNSNIILNQVGYKPFDNKKIIFRGDYTGKEFNVISKKNNKVVYTGKIKDSMYDEASEEVVSTGEFTELQTSGKYYIEVNGIGKSNDFIIDNNVYTSVFKDIQKFLYYQRCGEDLDRKYAGEWAHEACHTELATIYGTDKKIDVSGGLHDAGDYGRYVVSTSKTTADLLLAYEDNKAAFTDDIGIPESGNGIPDILDTVRYQLEWLLKMQDKESGGVYHKVTTAKFSGHIMPEDDKDELIVSPISTTATGDFAAVMAMGYESYKSIDEEFAKICLDAAEEAWIYLENNPYGSFKNPEGIETGEYSDESDVDERYWAAAQLYKATKKQKYNNAFIEMVNNKIETGYDWRNVGYYGSVTYMNTKGADEEVYKKLKKSFLGEAYGIMDRANKDAYNISIGTNYHWGSNLSVTSNGIVLAKAYEINQDKELLNMAKEHVNYCFGKNSLCKSFVTGYGVNTVENPHHRLSIVKEKTIKGMLVGGPNSELEDEVVKDEYYNVANAKCYSDNENSYSTNEVTIYWNSSLINLMSKLGMY